MQAKKDEAKFGFTGSAENLNGRMAMIGFVALDKVLYTFSD
jgi:hypothetical protein